MSRLGRNPFENKPRRAIDFVREMEKEAAIAVTAKTGMRTKLARFFLVDLRAESYLFGLKAYLLSVSILE